MKNGGDHDVTSAGARTADTPADRRLDSGEVKRRVADGAVVLMARGALIRILGLGANIVLARLLVPSDFGLVALGLAAYQLGSLLSDAGMGAALIRRPSPPTRPELRSVLGLQLVVTMLVALVTLAVAVALYDGGDALVIAIIVSSLPLSAWRPPAGLQLQRSLSFRPIARAEIVQLAVYNTWAIVTVALGAGVWGMATASIPATAAASVLIVAAAPVRVLRPALHWSALKPLFGFGLRYQAVPIANTLKNQAVNVGTAAISGTATLGLWTLAYRILTAPYLVFESLWRVSYPGVARLMETGESPAPAIKRGATLVAVAAGALYAPVIASAPALIPAVFGAKWEPVASVLPIAGLGLMIAGPSSAAASGFLFATGEAGLILRTTLAVSVIWLAVGLTLLAPLGVAALGVAWLLSAIVNVAIFDRALQRRIGVSLLGAMALPFAVAVAAAGCGWIIASSREPTLAVTLETVVLSEALFWAGLAVTQRSTLREFVRIGVRSIRRAATARG